MDTSVLCEHESHENVKEFFRPSLIEGECVENILPNGRCFADVTTKMCHAVLTIPLDSPHSPFSISPQ